jgi:hypothetical protein
MSHGSFHEFLANKTIPVVSQPPYSPDLSRARACVWNNFIAYQQQLTVDVTLIKKISGESLSTMSSMHCINKLISLPRRNDIDRISENVPRILDGQTQT